MTFKNFHLASRIDASEGDNLVPRLHVPIVPVLIGALAAVNVASVVLALLG